MIPEQRLLEATRDRCQRQLTALRRLKRHNRRKYLLRGGDARVAELSAAGAEIARRLNLLAGQPEEV